MINPATYVRRKRRMKAYAIEHKLPIPTGFRPLIPAFGRPARALLMEIQRFKKWLPTGVWDEHVQYELFWPTTAEVALFALAHKAGMIYTEGSQRMEGVKKHMYLPDRPVHGDCSAFATWTKFASHKPDPNGENYDGYGYTGTLLLHGHQTDSPEPGDFAFYNHPVSHVAVCVGGGKVVSFGQQGGPYLEGINQYGNLNGVRRYA